MLEALDRISVDDLVILWKNTGHWITIRGKSGTLVIEAFSRSLRFSGTRVRCDQELTECSQASSECQAVVDKLNWQAADPT